MSPNRLLIIDDDAGMANLFATIARACQYEVQIAGLGSVFREKYLNWHPTHVILDLHLPDTDGIELIRFLSLEKSTAMIIVASGTDSKMLETVRRLGTERGLRISGTVAKPFRAAEVKGLLTSLTLASDEIDRDSIAAAIQGEQLSMVYQPKMKLSPFCFAGFEALVRWNHPQRGMISPVKFIPIAEQSGLMEQLTRKVIDLSLRQLNAWQKLGLQTSVAVNMSGKNLARIETADEIAAQCAQNGVDSRCLTLEVTETAAAGSVTDAIDILARLRLKGFRLSIDDFGTGYSSLKQLRRMPFSELKIDIEFVRDCVKNEEDRVLVKTIIDLAHNLGLSAVAEGVEDEATFKLLKQLGCDSIQGYYFSPPLAPDKAFEWATQLALIGDIVGPAGNAPQAQLADEPEFDSDSEPQPVPA